jgi:hypothetical protein
MNPAAQPATAAQQTQPIFTNAHNNVFEGLRQTLMQHVHDGVPGMEKVLNTLNAEHAKGVGARGAAGAMPLRQPSGVRANLTEVNRGNIDPQNGAMIDAITAWLKSNQSAGGFSTGPGTGFIPGQGPVNTNPVGIPVPGVYHPFN